MYANSEMKTILAKFLEPDDHPVFEFKSEVYQLQVLIDEMSQSRMQEEQVLQQNQKQVVVCQCFLQSTDTECNVGPVTKGCLSSTTFALPLDSDNGPRLDLNFGPQVDDALPSTSSAAQLTIGNSHIGGAPLDKKSGIILSLASPPPSPPRSPPPPTPSPPHSPSPPPASPRSPSPSYPSFPTHSDSCSPYPGYPTYSPPHSPRSEPSPTPPPSPPPFTPSPSPVPPPTAQLPTPPDSPEAPPLPPGPPPELPSPPDSPYPYPSFFPPWM